MTREETQLFLEAVDADFQLLFLTLLRTGMRWGEAAALRWGDIQFGSSEEDQNRFIWVRRNWVQGKFTSPKSKKTRRIDIQVDPTNPGHLIGSVFSEQVSAQARLLL